MHPNVAQTRKYYEAMSEAELCSCAYCRNYRLRIRTEYATVAEYLDTLGVDAAKPFETSPLEPEADGWLEYYSCQYVVFGSCAADEEHKAGGVVFRKAASFPEPGIAEEHFVLECDPIRLRYEVTP